MITLLLLLIINICSTLPLEKDNVQYGTAKLTDGVPTPSHYLPNSKEKEPTQALPIATSDGTLPFPQVHVTSEVRTVSLQITEDGVPVMKSIVNPVVFAKEPRDDEFFEPTEMEPPVYSPTSTYIVNNSTTSDNLVTIQTQNHTSKTSKQIIPRGKIFIPDRIPNHQKETTSNDYTPNNGSELNNKSKIPNEISRKPKRIQSFGDIKNKSRSEYSTANAHHGEKEIVPTSFQQKYNTKTTQSEMEIFLTKRRQKKTEDVIIRNETHHHLHHSTNKQNWTSLIENPINRTRNPLLVDDDLVDDIQMDLVSEVKSKNEEIAKNISKDENHFVVEPRESFWRARVRENEDSVQDGRNFSIEKINKEGISQLLFNSKDGSAKIPNNHSSKSDMNKDSIHDISETKMLRKINKTSNNQHVDLMETSSLNSELPEAVLKSQDKVILMTSEGIMKNKTAGLENNAEFINISRQNDGNDSVQSSNKPDIKSSNSHQIKNVQKSRALEPYVEFYDKSPSVSPNQQISSPVSEQLDTVLAPGCVAAIVLGVLLCALAAMGSLAFVVYNRHSGIRPKMLSSDRSCANSDSGGYFDDQCRVAYLNSQTDVSKGTPEDLVSLDNDSFLNSLESMTIQNLWTDSIKHTKL